MRLILTAALAVVAAPLLAQEMKMPATPPGAPIAARAVAGTYKVDSDHTQILFSVSHLGFSRDTGQFVQPTGSLVLDPRNPARDRVEISFPIARVSTTSAALDEQLRKPEFFDAAKFPEGRFISTHVTVKGLSATIAGKLTVHGITRPVTLRARLIGAGREFWGEHKAAIGFSATASIKRSDFGINSGIPLVSDEVELTIEA
ncbi:YceI family protein [Sphingomonas sp. RT2P30]|uniref:YceI family protein n=1 Tax=Parasphingomonas halimpatiens TaxID=3096162 RepID=UPI002FCB4570